MEAVGCTGEPWLAGKVAVPLLRFTYFLTFLLWTLLVVGFAIKAPEKLQYATGAAALLCSVVSMAIRPIYALYLLPLISLIGPILSIHVPGMGLLTIADIYLLLIVAGYIIFSLVHTKPLHFGPYWQLWLLVALLIVVSWSLSKDAIKCAPALINMLELGLVYFLSLNFVARREHVRSMLNSWVLASLVCSLLVLQKYSMNEPLLLGNEAYGGEVYANIVKESEFDFYRATYFYANSFFTLAVAVIIILVELLFDERMHRKMKVLFLFALSADTLAILLMNNKTALATLVVASGVILGCGLWRYFQKGRITTKTLGIACVVLLVSALGIYSAIPYLVSDIQFVAAVARIEAHDSFSARLGVWNNVVSFTRTHPKTLLIGLGPEAMSRLQDDPEIADILYNWDLGISEGAVDSSYLSVVLEYGILVFLVLGLVVMKTMRQLWATIMAYRDASLMALGFSIAAWLLMGLTQVTGISKPTWLLVQLLALANLMTSSRFVENLNNTQQTTLRSPVVRPYAC